MKLEKYLSGLDMLRKNNMVILKSRIFLIGGVNWQNNTMVEETDTYPRSIRMNDSKMRTDV